MSIFIKCFPESIRFSTQRHVLSSFLAFAVQWTMPFSADLWVFQFKSVFKQIQNIPLVSFKVPTLLIKSWLGHKAWGFYDTPRSGHINHHKASPLIFCRSIRLAIQIAYTRKSFFFSSLHKCENRVAGSYFIVHILHLNATWIRWCATNGAFVLLCIAFVV